MLIISNIGDHVWLMTSKQTDPLLFIIVSHQPIMPAASLHVPSLGMVVHLQLVDVRVKYPIHEANARGLVRVLVWQFDMYFPDATLERSCRATDVSD